MASSDHLDEVGLDDSVHRWLKRLELSMAFPHEFWVATPRWVKACWDFAVWYPTIQIHDARWKEFLLFLLKMPDITGAIDTVARLGGLVQRRTFIGDHFERFLELRAKTPVLDRLGALQMRRRRRLEGRAGRAPDGLYEAEAERGAPQTKRERELRKRGR